MPRPLKATCIICCLSLMIGLFAIPAYAETEILYPDDYIDSISVSGDIKTVTYDFSSIRWFYAFYEDDKEPLFGYDNFTVDLVGATNCSVSCLPFGTDSDISDETLFYIGDIAYGSEIDVKFSLRCVSEWLEQSANSITGCYFVDWYCFDADFQLVEIASNCPDSQVEFEVELTPEGYYSFDVNIETTLNAKSVYVAPVFWMKFDLPTDYQSLCTFSFYSGHCSIYVDINTILENSAMMQSIENKLSDINGQLGSVNDKLDEIIKQPEQEKNDAQQGANDAFSGVVDVVPDHSEGLVDAFSGLAASMSYDGTAAKLDLPDVTMPGIDGLFEGFIIMENQSVDFEAYFDMLPDELLFLVQSLFTAALIVFCFKELYSTIQYCLTLRG